MQNNKINYLIDGYKPIDPVILGRIGSVYGIFGWLNFISYTENKKDIFSYLPWFIKNGYGWQFVIVEKWRYISNKLIIKIKDIQDRFSAKLMVNNNIFVEHSQLPKLSDNEYYWFDLIGCIVITVSEYKLGKIVHIMETGANDVLVVRRKLSNIFSFKEYLIPFVYPSVIKEINLKQQIIYVDWDPVF